MKKRGGAIKPSDVLLGTAGGLGVASGVSALTGVGAVASPFLAAGSGITAGVSSILKAFGAGLPQSAIKRLNSIHNRHAKGGRISKKQINTDINYINKIAKKAGNLSSGGQLKTGGSLLTGGQLENTNYPPKRKQNSGMHAQYTKYGSKAKVYHGNAEMTTGGLTKADLMMNKRGRIVSKKKYEQGLKRYKENKLKPKTAEELAKLRARR